MKKEINDNYSVKFNQQNVNEKPLKDKSTVNKGNLLEYRIKRLLFRMGYYCKTNIDIKATADLNPDTISDLDVYGIYIHKDFSQKNIWADCKSGKAKPLERIAWINGVKNITGIDDVIFVKKGIRLSTKQYALNKGVRIFDYETIDELEHNYGIEQNDWRGSWNPQIANYIIALQKIGVPNVDSYKKIGNFIVSDFWELDNYTRCKKSITALKQLNIAFQASLELDQLQAIQWGIYEITCLFTYSLLTMANDVYYISESDKENLLRNGFVAGEIPLRKRKEMVEAIYKIVNTEIKYRVPEFAIELEAPPGLGMAPPNYFNAIFDVINRITKSPLKYYDLLRYMDFTLMEYDMKKEKWNQAELAEIFNNSTNLYYSAKTILHFICDIIGVNKELFQIFEKE